MLDAAISPDFHGPEVMGVEDFGEDAGAGKISWPWFYGTLQDVASAASVACIISFASFAMQMGP